MYTDLDKQEILDKLAELDAEAETFEKTRRSSNVQAIAIAWVGFSISKHYAQQKEILE